MDDPRHPRPSRSSLIRPTIWDQTPEYPSGPILVPLLNATDFVTSEEDAALARAVRIARRGDASARNAVWSALEPKLARAVAREAGRTWAGPGARRDGRPWDADDLRQEAFLVFVDLLEEWPGEGAVVPFLLTYFPWRLRDVRRRLEVAARRECAALSPDVGSLHDASAGAEEARVLLEELASQLAPLDASILLGYVRDGERLGAIAQRLHRDRATISRHWRALRADLRHQLATRTARDPSPGTPGGE